MLGILNKTFLKYTKNKFVLVSQISQKKNLTFQFEK